MPIAVLLASVAFCGCAGMGSGGADFWWAGSWWKAAQVDDITRRARDLEAQGELAMALEHWRLIERVAVDQRPAREEIRRLSGDIAAGVDDRYQQGIAEMKAGNAAAARNHFLAALRLDPSFEPARRQIQATFSPFPLMVYHTAPGDRPATIARTVYGDADKAFLVSWFNDLPARSDIPPQTLLILPKLGKKPVDTEGTAAPKVPPSRLDEARSRLSAGDLDGALELSAQLDADDPAVMSLIHTIHLKQAGVQTDDGQLDAARQSLSMVPDGVAGKAAVLARLEAALTQRQIDQDIEAARRFYAEDDFQASLELTTAVLARAPENTEARRLTDEARYGLALDLFNRKQFVAARAVLEKADAAHDASTALKQKVSEQLKAAAQRYYRSGVKHFINEDLQAAVDAWEMALVCNPELEKARENIANARRIMQKVENLP